MDKPHVEALIERGRRAPGGPSEGAWFDELDSNRAEVDAHVRSVLVGGDGNEVATLGARLWPYWVRRATDGTEWLEAATSAAATLHSPPSQDLSLLLYGAGLAAFRRGDNDKSRGLNQRALEVAEAVGSDTGKNRALIGLSRAAFRDGNFSLGADQAAAAGAVAERAGDEEGLTLAMHMEAELRRASGDYGAAIPLYEHLLTLDRSAEDDRAIAMELYNLGSVLLQTGDLDRAESCLRESLDRAVVQQAVGQIPYSLLGLAGLAARRGDARAAGQLLGAVEAHFEAEGEVLDPAEQIELASHKTIGAGADPDAFALAYAGGRSQSLEDASGNL